MESRFQSLVFMGPTERENYWGLGNSSNDRCREQSGRSEMRYSEVGECPLLAESGRWLTVNMQGVAYDRFWPEADIRQEFQAPNGCWAFFGRVSGRF